MDVIDKNLEYNKRLEELNARHATELKKFNDENSHLALDDQVVFAYVQSLIKASKRILPNGRNVEIKNQILKTAKKINSKQYDTKYLCIHDTSSINFFYENSYNKKLQKKFINNSFKYLEEYPNSVMIKSGKYINILPHIPYMGDSSDLLSYSIYQITPKGFNIGIKLSEISNVSGEVFSTSKFILTISRISFNRFIGKNKNVKLIRRPAPIPLPFYL